MILARALHCTNGIHLGNEGGDHRSMSSRESVNPLTMISLTSLKVLFFGSSRSSNTIRHGNVLGRVLSNVDRTSPGSPDWVQEETGTISKHVATIYLGSDASTLNDVREIRVNTTMFSDECLFLQKVTYGCAFC